MGETGNMDTRETPSSRLGTISREQRVDMAGKKMQNFARMRRESQESFSDDLTKLPNRRGFKRDIEKMISYSIRSGKLVGHGFADIDFFKQTNDIFGHDVADTFLRGTADSFRSIIREVDVAGRCGGDEFEFGFYNVPSLQAAETIINKFHTALAVPIFDKATGKTYYPQISMGLVFGCNARDDTLEYQTTLSESLMRLLKSARETNRETKLTQEEMNELMSRSRFNFVIADREGQVHASTRGDFIGKTIYELTQTYDIQINSPCRQAGDPPKGRRP